MAIRQKGWEQAGQVVRVATAWLGAAAFCLSANLVMAGDAARDITQAQAMQMLNEEPGLVQKVAAANGLSTMRLMSLETPTILATVREYLVRRERANAAGAQRREPGMDASKPP